MFAELEANKEEIKEKAKITEKDFQKFIAAVKLVVRELPEHAYHSYLEEANKVIGYYKDAPFLAAAIAEGDCDIWTNDRHFIGKEAELFRNFHVKVWTTKKLFELVTP